ncbi:AcrR family transcriptional regulator [Peteryoungia aggregata LMG 23059]|uniref:AcrR family transcriptional regulator n=1 Tax=Peteryoungia aggregata LMG 23059 TaxID=1368425 RepID=A0ABU0GEI7_9HYPH|nr:TetR/AcrR family transcriptional regulator [Peteryoungia aggregata]MDQ0422995.1 AcrR family transcriptional regulator [Peteryoungia aggregata LMG 23059]
MKLSQQRSRQTRDQILAAARDLFARQGFEPTSIDQIAVAAKVAKSSVFAHFGDKANLLAALGLAEIEALARRGRESLTQDDDLTLEEKLKRLFDPWLAYFGREPDFARLYLSQSGLTAGTYTEAFLVICRDLEAQVADLFLSRLPDISTEEALMLSRGAQALFHEAVVFRMSGWLPDQHSAHAMLNAFLATWVAGARHKAGA